jgi:hypothetical protein
MDLSQWESINQLSVWAVIILTCPRRDEENKLTEIHCNIEELCVQFNALKHTTSDWYHLI